MADPQIRSNGRIRCVFATVFWGDWHRGMFLRANLPTMLAARNLPALAAGIECEYLIYTTAKDAAEIRRDPAFKRLQSLLPVTLKVFTPSRTKHPITLHHDVWRQATKHARRRQAFILLMPPDVAWADGSFARLRTALEAGKRVMFMAYPRVVSESIVPAMTKQFPRAADHSATIPAPEMMALAMTHLHPLMAAYSRFSAHFPIHPEMILWPVEGDGFLLRLLARELFCFEPGRYSLNAQSLLSRLPPAGEIQVFRDSREFLGISLTPLWKDMEWYLPRAISTRFSLAAGGSTMRVPSTTIFRHSTFVLPAAEATKPAGGCVEQQARNTLTHFRSAQEFVRVLIKLQEIGHSRAAAFLASALRVHGLARRWPHRGPFVVLAPDDAAFEGTAFDRVPGDGMSAGEARAMLEAHVAIRRSIANDGNAEVKTLAGEVLQIGDLKSAWPCGDHLVVPVRRMLCRPPAAERALPAAPDAHSVMRLPA